MRRILSLLALSVALTLAMASVASAQGFPSQSYRVPNPSPEDFTGQTGCPPELVPFGDPSGFACLTPEDNRPYRAGEFELKTLPTLEELQSTAASEAPAEADEVPADAQQYAEDAPTASATPAEELPDTGGPALLPLAALLVGSGTLGLVLLRRRAV